MCKLKPFSLGLYVIPPKGSLIINKRKKLLASTNCIIENIGTPLYLLSGKKACGIIELGTSKKVSLKEFKKLYSEHRISEPERIKLWPDASIFYVTKINVINNWKFFVRWRSNFPLKMFIENVMLVGIRNKKPVNNFF